jgi:ABC-2 type transport system permease protein
MGKIFTIARREATSPFVTARGYVVLFLFLLVMGIMFLWPVIPVFSPGLSIDVAVRNLMRISRISLFIVLPLITMSIFSEEYRSGRIEMLRTSPFTEYQLLLGKYFGALVFYLALMACTMIYLLILAMFASPDYGQVLSCYLGMGLMGCMFVAVGLFFSAWSSEQIVGGLLAFIVLAFLNFADLLSSGMPREFAVTSRFNVPIRSIMDYLTVGGHFSDFSRGSVELGNMVYFVGFSALYLFWTYVVLESKKWR